MTKLKTKETITTCNPFSDTLNNLIDGVYSEDHETSHKSFNLLVAYFKTNLATKSEISFIIMSNNHGLVKLIYNLEKGYKELLSKTVGQVVKDNLSLSLPLDYTLDDEVPELIGCSDE